MLNKAKWMALMKFILDAEPNQSRSSKKKRGATEKKRAAKVTDADVDASLVSMEEMLSSYSVDTRTLRLTALEVERLRTQVADLRCEIEDDEILQEYSNLVNSSSKQPKSAKKKSKKGEKSRMSLRGVDAPTDCTCCGCSSGADTQLEVKKHTKYQPTFDKCLQDVSNMFGLKATVQHKPPCDVERVRVLEALLNYELGAWASYDHALNTALCSIELS